MAINEKSGTEQLYPIGNYGGSLKDTQPGITGNGRKHLDRLNLFSEINVRYHCFFKKLL